MSTIPSPPSGSLPKPRQERLPASRTLELLRAEHGVFWLLFARLGIELCLVSQRAADAARDWFLGEAFWFFAAGGSLALSLFIFRGARAMFGTAAAWVYTLLSLIPCIGLLVAFALLLDLRDVLRQTGAGVGLFGATHRQIQAWQAKAQQESAADA